ncbi:MAG: LLM class flavin-dependent oxidoreductase, partial [Actinobacteria bacterium]|nr:LLM class flavin-dependent oxidoreductase [Actinomycetota bacterium]
KKTLRIAAQYARYTNFDATPEVFRRKSEILEQHCRDVGRDFGEITRSGNYNVVIGATEADVRDKLAWILDHYRPLLPPAEFERYRSLYENGPLVGTPEQLVERLQQAADLGLGYAIANFIDAAYDPTSQPLFVDEVIPAFR